MYTNDCTSTSSSVKLLKFADDTTVIGLIQDGNGQEVVQLPSWCSHGSLELNTLRTVELTIDLRRASTTATAVASFKFLGTTISKDL